MASFIVGTAGHIDHGKSSLVLALTGTDPDRLKEEKERGITIELGFAHLELASGLVASFIDVPGHERFVRTMLAGAHGIDAVLLVVAADESVMPQTREHFHICRLLGVERGLVALTKCDAADPELQALAELEVRELVRGSFLEGAPVLRVSARSGAGLPALRDALAALGSGVARRSEAGLLRLPIDRVFTLRGFGTVVTGTLVSGALAVGDEIEVLPSGRRGRVRGLHVHGQPVSRVGAGNRAAVNLAGLEVFDLARGEVIALPGALRASSILEAELSLLPGERALQDQARVRVHVKSAEVLARVRVLGAREVAPGTTARVQLRLESPAVAARGDRLILRSYSPATTLGGALVLDPQAPKRRTAPLTAAVAADAAQAARAFVIEAGASGIEAGGLAARVGVPVPALLALLEAEPGLVRLGRDPLRLVSRTALDGLAQATRQTLARFHAERRLAAGMSREELKARVFARAAEGAHEHVLGELAGAGEIAVQSDLVALASHRVALSPEEALARDELLAAALAAGLAGVEPAATPMARRDPKLCERVARVLTSAGALVRVGETLVLPQHLRDLEKAVRDRFSPGARLDVAAFKEISGGLSRKYAIPLLEHLDRTRVTRRSGADRFVL
jgi:selenocysteine-specific elongation factor